MAHTDKKCIKPASGDIGNQIELKRSAPQKRTSEGNAINPERNCFWLNRWQRIVQANSNGQDNEKEAGKFWSDRKRVHAMIKHHTNDRRRIAARMARMAIPEGSRVLDIGAGPGTFAIPLAASGCAVTVVEPSPVMREVMAENMQKNQVDSITTIPRRWEDVDPAELGEPFDFIIASYFLLTADIEMMIKKIQACCKGTVHMYWFLTPFGMGRATRDLWPYLHEGEFPGHLTADLLWQVLYEMGIYANLEVETENYCPVIFPSVDEAVERFCHKMKEISPEQKAIVRDYLQDLFREDGDHVVMTGQTLAAHIWWNNASKENCC